MKRFWKLAGIATLVAILGVAAIGTVAFAQDDDSGGPFNFGARIKELVADALGISVEQYESILEQARGQVVDEALEEGWLTEDQVEKMQEHMEQRAEGGRMGKGFMAPGMGPMGRGDASLANVAAEKLGLSLEDLRAELQDGKSIADVAAEKGVNTQDIIDAYLAELETSLTEQVTEGKITQKQADWMLEQATERAPEQLDGTWEGPGPGGFPGGGRRPGGKGGFPGQNDQNDA
jgi:hypothetical protein